MKELSMIRIVKKQRKLNIAVENIDPVSKTVLRLARDALPVE